MHVNNFKSNVVHFRGPPITKTIVHFTCGPDIISFVDKYTYLGITLMEFLDYEGPAKNTLKSKQSLGSSHS